MGSFAACHKQYTAEWWDILNSNGFEQKHADLDCQFGDTALDGSSPISDEHIHAVILGVLQAEWPHLHNKGCCVVCRKRHINTQGEVHPEKWQSHPKHKSTFPLQNCIISSHYTRANVHLLCLESLKSNYTASVCSTDRTRHKNK